ncbi:MAG: FAD-dependent oxidoreductase, partial [Myxococcales bacterium]|nr:FAD-dependent oxidoreductase [Myxococcales bacterium]
MLPRDAIDATAATRGRYGTNRLPEGDRAPAAVLRPASTAEVETIVRLANLHRIPLYPISTGENSGLGLRSPSDRACAVVDLGAKMKRILEVDETLGYAVIEPGVSYRALYEELERRGHPLMMDTTSGPPDGGIVGNTLDKGAGYTPYFDHFGMSCGLEVVLGNGRVLRTADGALPGSHTWHLSKYGYGPFLDGLFLQSNFGIVTRLGVWLMPRPPVIRSFFFLYPDDGDLAEIMERVRPLKQNNVVPTLLKVTSDLYGLGTVATHPGAAVDGSVAPLSDDDRRALRAEHGLGAWCVSGAFYGASEAAVAPLIERARAHFEASGRAHYVPHEEALEHPAHRIHVDTFSGRPTESELALLDWRPGAGAMWFLPATPVVGAIADH